MQPAFRYVVFTLRPLLIAASDTMAVNIDKSVSSMFQTQEVKHVIPVAHGLERVEVPFQQRILRLRNGNQVGPIASGRPPFSTGLFRISISQRQIFAPAANKSRTYLPMRFDGSIRMMMQASVLKQQQDICFLSAGRISGNTIICLFRCLPVNGYQFAMTATKTVSAAERFMTLFPTRPTSSIQPR